jgi:two-component system, chemotaxis family, protein-glutamate methylesterase/glutaminase
MVSPMPSRDVVVVGASAGGVEALRALVGGLPPDLPAAVLVVLHMPRFSPSALPLILHRAGPLPAAAAVDGQPLARGRVYVSAVDHHLLILDGRVRLSTGPLENGHRPAIDPLFRSAARAYGSRVVGVVLSGARDDGAAGLAAIVGAGGVAVVQDPADALHASMPRVALEHTTVDHVVPAGKMGPLIAELVQAAADIDRDDPDDSELLTAEVAMANHAPLSTDELNVPAAGYGCPNCGGALFEIHSRPVPRFRCRVGHAWSPDSLLEEQAIALEGALWMALRTLEEKKALSQRMASTGFERRLPGTTRRYRMLADDAQRAVDLIRDVIARLGRTSGAEETHSEE